MRMPTLLEPQLDVTPSARSASGDSASGAEPGPPTLADVVRSFAESRDTDVYFFSGPVDRQRADDLQEQVPTNPARSNAALILTTLGGDADAAFIIARSLKRRYQRFALYVYGHCKSAGTLIALGADEVVMGPRGEFGPLDVQMMKDDEVMLRSSGLDIFQALNILNGQTFDIFTRHFFTLKRMSASLTTKTAADIATALAVGVVEPIAAQIDPLRLGEVQRAISIANDYAQRLGADPDSVQSLVTQYPSHSFVIDREEAEDLFKGVRAPDDDEDRLANAIRASTHRAFHQECVRIPHSEGFVQRLTPPHPYDYEEPSDDSPDEDSAPGHSRSSGRSDDEREVSRGPDDPQEPQQADAEEGKQAAPTASNGQGGSRGRQVKKKKNG